MGNSAQQAFTHFTYDNYIFSSRFPCFVDMQDSKKMYLLDGSFISGILPYEEYESVMKHPLWGSNLIFNNGEAVVKAHRDYIRGSL